MWFEISSCHVAHRTSPLRHPPPLRRRGLDQSHIGHGLISSCPGNAPGREFGERVDDGGDGLRGEVARVSLGDCQEGSELLLHELSAWTRII